MANFTRFTTDYIEVEDRIRLTGVLPDDTVVTLWLTLRLVNRVIPHLAAWLERPTANVPLASLRQEMEQQRATLELQPLPPVGGAGAAPGVLIRSVDIRCTETVATMVFKTAAGDSGDQIARIAMQATLLRQWLGVLHGFYKTAEWPMAVWPAWIEAAPLTGQPAPGGMRLN